MAPRPLVPAELTRRPFTLAEAIQVGLTRWQLRSQAWRRLGGGVYVRSGLQESPLLLIGAAHARLPTGAVFSGGTAAWLHGLDVPVSAPVEVTVPPHWEMSARSVRFAAPTSQRTKWSHGRACP